MPDPFATLRNELAVANRILANEGIIDAFGHISVRSPKKPDRYFISRHRASELVEPDDILEMTLDSDPVRPTGVRLYSEMVIHGEIYKARADVNSVCHHHAPAVLPFCATGVELVPLFHLGATLGGKVPFWDSRDEFGDTNLLVRTPEEGASHARALGRHFMVLLRRHGATLAGRSVRECVFRTIYTTRNAELQLRAMAIGTLAPLSPGEIEKCGGSQSRRPRGRARLGVLGHAAAEGGGDVGGRRPAPDEGLGRGGAAADRRAAAGAPGDGAPPRQGQRPQAPVIDRGNPTVRFWHPAPLREHGETATQISQSLRRAAKLSPKEERYLHTAWQGVSGDAHAKQADLSGPMVARRAMGPRA